MSETELAQHFVEYLSDFDLYFEAPPGRVDIVALSGKKRFAIEVKTTLNFKVIEQAYDNTKYFHLSYIAVPRVRHKTFAYKICADYGIGVLICHHSRHYGTEKVEEVIKPRYNNIPKHYLNYGIYHDWMKKSKPGASGKSGEVMTAFKITVENLTNYVTRHPGCSIKDAINGIEHHYMSTSAAKSSIYQWLRSGVIDTVRLNDGKLNLNGETI